MASYQAAVVTDIGRKALRLLMSQDTNFEFTRLEFSSYKYNNLELKMLTELKEVKQSVSVSNVSPSPYLEQIIEVKGVVTNTDLTEDYDINTVGLYVKNTKSNQEILYAVCSANVPNHMPSYDGKIVSSAIFKFLVSVSSSKNVSFEVDPEGVATLDHVQELQSVIAELQAYVGYTDEDIYGVEVDFLNKKFTRLAGAVNNGWQNCHAIMMRRRVEIDNDGKISSDKDKQIMVYQPKFYYKVVPLLVDHDGGLQKVRYYISDFKREGFKVHPAFLVDGKEVECIYLAAYEGCVQNASTREYVIDNTQGGFSNNWVLASRPNVHPATGWGYQSFNMASGSRDEYGEHGIWSLSTIQSISATQMLFLIEYASFNIQDKLGMGATQRSEPMYTGGTVSLGDQSGSLYGAVSYRGEENIFGNIWTFVDGITITRSGGVKIGSEKTNIPFTHTGSNFMYSFYYSEEFDWLFFPFNSNGDHMLPVGDEIFANDSSTNTFYPLLGGDFEDYVSAGLFALNCEANSTKSDASFGARLLYTPNP